MERMSDVGTVHGMLTPVICIIYSHLFGQVTFVNCFHNRLHFPSISSIVMTMVITATSIA